MAEQEVYQKFINWLRKTWWGLPDSEQLLPLIKARYTVKEAKFLTGFPFSGRSLEELVTLKSMSPDQLGPYLDDLARRASVDPARAMTTLTLMELEGWVSQVAGMRFCRVGSERPSQGSPVA